MKPQTESEAMTIKSTSQIHSQTADHRTALWHTTEAIAACLDEIASCNDEPETRIELWRALQLLSMQLEQIRAIYCKGIDAGTKAAASQRVARSAINESLRKSLAAVD